jgi:hypothetical protein
LTDDDVILTEPNKECVHSKMKDQNVCEMSDGYLQSHKFHFEFINVSNHLQIESYEIENEINKSHSNQTIPTKKKSISIHPLQNLLKQNNVDGEKLRNEKWRIIPVQNKIEPMFTEKFKNKSTQPDTFIFSNRDMFMNVFQALFHLSDEFLMNLELRVNTILPKYYKSFPNISIDRDVVKIQREMQTQKI